LVAITRFYVFGGPNYDLCDVTYEEVEAQQNSLLNFLNTNPEQSGTVSFWVVNVTIVNDKFDFDPYNRGNGDCVTTNIGETVIKAFYIPERPSATPSVSLIPSESTSPSLEPSVSYAPSTVPSVSYAPSTVLSAATLDVIRSVAPSISTNPTGIPSDVPTLSYAPTAHPSESPSDKPSGAPTPKIWGGNWWE